MRSFFLGTKTTLELKLSDFTSLTLFLKPFLDLIRCGWVIWDGRKFSPKPLPLIKVCNLLGSYFMINTPYLYLGISKWIQEYHDVL